MINGLAHLELRSALTGTATKLKIYTEVVPDGTTLIYKK